MEPSSPGAYIGQHQDGYFWNGTSWDKGETLLNSATTPSPAPSPAPAPAPTPASSASTSPSRRGSILGTIMRVESGGKNVPQRIDDINMRNGDPAQGYYQITGGTWNEFGGGKTGQKSPLGADYGTQLQIAQNIPVARWGPATQQALKAAGYEPQPGETLGQMLARYKEDPAATRPEDVGGSGDGGTKPATPTVDLSGLYAGLLAKQQDQTATTARAAALAEEAKQQAANASAVKQGMGLLAAGQTAAPQVALPSAAIHRPQAQPLALGGDTPDFTSMLAQQRLMRRG